MSKQNAYRFHSPSSTDEPEDLRELAYAKLDECKSAGPDFRSCLFNEADALLTYAEKLEAKAVIK